MASSLAYSALSSRFLSARFFLRAKRARFLCSTTGVTRRWILGALDLAFLPSFSGRGRLTTYCPSSSLVRLKRRRIFDALLGPRRRGTVVSVRPSISPSPFLTMTIAKTERLASTIHPWTLFLRRSPVRRGRKQLWPLLSRRRTLPLVSTPCFIGNPCLSLPPLMRNT